MVARSRPRDFQALEQRRKQVYTMVRRQVEYDESLWAERDSMRHKRVEARLHKQAAKHGYKLVPLQQTASSC